MLREPKPTFDADQIGIDTLKFIASHEDLMQRFIDLTGFDAATLRAEAAVRASSWTCSTSSSAMSRTCSTSPASSRCRRQRSGRRATRWRRGQGSRSSTSRADDAAPMGQSRYRPGITLAEAHDHGAVITIGCHYCRTKRHYLPQDLRAILGNIVK